MEKKTPLYQAHVDGGGKIVPFAGYLLPVQYQLGVMKEHLAVRTACGLFDVSHMGEITIKGVDALKNLNYLLTNDFTNMKLGQARYTMMCYDDGGIVDDLIVYKLAEENYLLVVNASNKDKDYMWIQDHVFGDIQLEDISDTIAQIALQGPKAHQILCKIVKEEDIPTGYYYCKNQVGIGGVIGIVSKTGYTGEDGYELYIPSEDAEKIWKLLLEVGAEDGLVTCGLGARDTLRLEASMPLYGHEMNEHINPFEVGLSFAVKMKKEDFIGKSGIEEKELTMCRVGLKAVGRGIIRDGETVYMGNDIVGHTTSGTHAPYLGYPIAMAMVDLEYKEIGTQVSVLVRGKRVQAEVIPMPFYKKGE